MEAVSIAHRFFAPDLREDAPFELPLDESHHLARVLRLTAGDEVRAFDGRGIEITARVVRVGGVAALAPIARVETVPEPAVRYSLAQAVLKTAAMDAVVRDATMTGVCAVQPVVASRSNWSAGTLRRGHAVERWHRIAVASAKQCGRAVVPDVRPPATLLEAIDARNGSLALIFVEPAASVPNVLVVDDLPRTPAPPGVLLLVGPEGGWSSDEVSGAVERGCLPLRLGRRTLRADAVAPIALSLLQFVWWDL
jgi:16S rRNA (uracil1498-N3)-methyltransferase